MIVEVFILMVTDPETGRAEPVVVNKRRDVVERVMADGKEALELRAFTESAENKTLLKKMSDSYEITTGRLTVDGYV